MRMKKWFSSLGYRFNTLCKDGTDMMSYAGSCPFRHLSCYYCHIFLTWVFSIFLLSLCWYGHVSGRSQKTYTSGKWKGRNT